MHNRYADVGPDLEFDGWEHRVHATGAQDHIVCVEHISDHF